MKKEPPVRRKWGKNRPNAPETVHASDIGLINTRQGDVRFERNVRNEREKIY